MAYELKDGQGSLWRNKDRKTDKHPAATGQAKIDGVMYRVAAWTNETQAGEKYQLLKFEPKKDEERQVPTPTHDELDDEIPF